MGSLPRGFAKPLEAPGNYRICLSWNLKEKGDTRAVDLGKDDWVEVEGCPQGKDSWTDNVMEGHTAL